MSDLNGLQQRLENIQDTVICIDCAIEEMAEATQVMTKYKRKSPKFTIERLTEEIAHAMLMLDVVRNKFSIPQSDIDEHKLMALKKMFKE